ncbi:MAG: ribonuclease III [Ktedonobacterales bacterium]
MASTTAPLPPREAAAIMALESVLGYRFTQPQLLVDALTHRSYAYEFAAPGVVSNERLEFLGDAVLALVSADLLYTLAPAAPEGELTAARAALVRASMLATFARRVGLGPHLRLGRGEDATGGRERELLLASAFEAVIGALYRDGGLAAASAVSMPLLRPEAERVFASRRFKDDKSLLQELAQARLGVTPSYRIVSAEGPSHERTFAVEVLLGDRVVASGEGRSKQQAEQSAARHALDDEGWQADVSPDAGSPTSDA